MSVRQDTQTRYCSTGDVARYLRGIPALTSGDDFPTESNAAEGEPSVSDVEGFIEKWTSRFDRKTGQSFRANQILDETHDHDRLYYWLSGHPINVVKRNIITPLDSSKGDKLEVWTGNKWEDWVSSNTREEGRDEDYWVDEAIGVIFIYERAILRPHPKFRVSYRYGGEDTDGDGIADYVPADVRDAVAAGAASDILRTDIYGTTIPGNSDDGATPVEMADSYEEQFRDTWKDYKKVRFV
jgi:hypothetical protein